MKKEIAIVDEVIPSKIYVIRNQKILLDRDLSQLYGVETKRLKEAVRRNRNRFPEDFMFELTKEEFKNWRTQFASSNSSLKMGVRYLPMVFTEQGIAMLSSVLKSEKAIAVNIQIVRLFTKMRNLLSENLNLKLEIEGIKKEERNNKKNVEVVFSYLDELLDKKESDKPVTKIGYKK